MIHLFIDYFGLFLKIVTQSTLGVPLDKIPTEHVLNHDGQRSGGEYPRPLGDKVAGEATPPQGQYSLSHTEQVTIDRVRRYWKTMVDTNFNVFNLTPFD